MDTKTLEKMGPFDLEVERERLKKEMLDAIEEVNKAESKLQELRKELEKKREVFCFVKGYVRAKNGY